MAQRLSTPRITIVGSIANRLVAKISTARMREGESTSAITYNSSERGSHNSKFDDRIVIILETSPSTGQLTAVSRQMEKSVPARPQPSAFPVDRYSNGLRILFIAFEFI